MIDWIFGPLGNLPTNPAINMSDEPGLFLSAIAMNVIVITAIVFGYVTHNAKRAASWGLLGGLYALEALFGMVGGSTVPGIDEQFNQPAYLAISASLTGMICLIGTLTTISTKQQYGWWKYINRYNLQHPVPAVKHVWRQRQRFTAGPLLALINALTALTIMCDYIAVRYEDKGIERMREAVEKSGQSGITVLDTATRWFYVENAMFWILELAAIAVLVYLPIQRRLRRRYEDAMYRKDSRTVLGLMALNDEPKDFLPRDC